MDQSLAGERKAAAARANPGGIGDRPALGDDCQIIISGGDINLGLRRKQQEMLVAGLVHKFSSTVRVDGIATGIGAYVWNIILQYNQRCIAGCGSEFYFPTDGSIGNAQVVIRGFPRDDAAVVQTGSGARKTQFGYRNGLIQANGPALDGIAKWVWIESRNAYLA